ncbi:MAG: hypothetical protein JSR21_05435 [Proteobacteria bacterium]|nr:hypothetical protein [Pseudomonadota bacterium]
MRGTAFPAWLGVLACAPLLAGCGPAAPLAAQAGAALTVGSIAAIQRTPVDAVYSAITGKDCSIVRLDQGDTYCKPVEPPPPPPQYCTRSIGNVDCWSNPQDMANIAPPLANGPTTLTPAQEQDRTRRWPPL